MRKRYLTALSTDSYLIGVLVLNESLKAANAAHPLCCLVTDNLKPSAYKALEKAEIEYIIRRPEFAVTLETAEKNAAAGHGGQWENTFFKLYMLGVPFDKIVFLDADAVVLQNIDELFGRPHLSACRDSELLPDEGGLPGFNSGVMVIAPDKNALAGAVRLVNNFKEGGGDQAIFRQMYPDWENYSELRLPRRYNVLCCRWWAERCFMDMPLYGENSIRVLHIIDKPWLDAGEQNRWVDIEIKKNLRIYNGAYKFSLCLKKYKKYEALALGYV
jgi:glycogenin glucosyltransferase